MEQKTSIDANGRKIVEGFMPYLGYKTYYRIVGERQEGKTPLLLLHGGPGSTHNYFETLDCIADSGYQLIMYDQLGCGNSYLDGHPELWTQETWMNELVALREYLHLDEVHILGQSWGGMMAIAYAVDFQPKGVKSIILSSACPSASLWSKEQHRMMKFLSDNERNVIKEAESTSNFSSPEYLAANDHYMQLFCSGPFTEKDPECLRRKKRSGAEAYLCGWGPNEYNPTGTLGGFEYLEKMVNIKIPTLVTSGTDDLCTPIIAKAMHDKLPNSEWYLFPGSRHMPFADDNATYCRVLLEWLGKN